MESQQNTETWKPIIDGMYEISSKGTIRSLDRIVATKGFLSHTHKRTHKGKIMKDFCNGNGYRYITISVNAHRKNYYVHRLVAETFIENPSNYNEVNHIDGKKFNNDVSNLEWCTKSENINHSYAIGLRKVRGEKLNAVKVIHISDNIVFDCMKDASEHYNLRYSIIKELLGRGASRTHKTHLYQNLMKLDKYIERNPSWAYEKGYSIKRLNK
jgi:hypothetical protein